MNKYYRPIQVGKFIVRFTKHPSRDHEIRIKDEDMFEIAEDLIKNYKKENYVPGRTIFEKAFFTNTRKVYGKKYTYLITDPIQGVQGKGEDMQTVFKLDVITLFTQGHNG